MSALSAGKENKCYILIASTEKGEQLLPWMGGDLEEAKRMADAYAGAEGSPEEMVILIGAVLAVPYVKKEKVKGSGIWLPGSAKGEEDER